MSRLNLRGGPEKIQNVLQSAGYDLHSGSHQSPAGLDAWLTPPTNYIGTTIFLSYIVAALLLTLFILLKVIIPRWAQRVRSRKVRILAVLAATSFSILSLNMISFLLQSFYDYLDSTDQDIAVEHLWPWMLNSNLFYDFAKSLLADSFVVAWTRSSLFMAMFMGAEMSYLGRRNQVSHLWAYFVLGQILPPSFAYYLLHLRTSMSAATELPTEVSEKDHVDVSPKGTSREALAMMVVLLAAVLSIANLAEATPEESPWMVLGKVFWLRLLLFMPLFMDTTSNYDDNTKRLLTGQQIILSGIIALTIGTSSYRNDLANHVPEFFRASFENAAIRTLTCDWMVKIVGDRVLKVLE